MSTQALDKLWQGYEDAKFKLQQQTKVWQELVVTLNVLVKQDESLKDCWDVLELLIDELKEAKRRYGALRSQVESYINHLELKGKYFAFFLLWKLKNMFRYNTSDKQPSSRTEVTDIRQITLPVK